MSLEEELAAVVERIMPEWRAETAAQIAMLLTRAGTRDDLVRIGQARSEPEDVRSTAIWALDRLDDRDGIARLMPLIRDEAELPSIRGDISRALAHWEDEGAVAVLRETLLSDTDAGVRAYAAWSLGFREPGPFVDDLVRVLNDTSDDSDVRGHAAEALGHLFDGSNVPPAARQAVRASVLEDDDTLRWDAVFALSVVGQISDIVLLKRILAAEKARDRPNTAVVEETERALEHLRRRRDRRPSFYA